MKKSKLKEKKKIGRPYKYTPEQLQIKVDEYFMYCEKEKKFPNVTGLALFLDVCRETVWDMATGKKNGLNIPISNIIKKAKMRIEDIVVRNVLSTSSVGGIFYLKSAYNYRDKSDIEMKQSGTINLKFQVMK